MAIKNINKKGVLSSRVLLVCIVLFGIIAGIGFLVVTDIASVDNGYNNSAIIDTNSQNNYHTINSISGDVYKMKNATESSEGLSILSTFTPMLKATISVVKIILNSFTVVENLFISLSLDLGIPPVIGTILVTGFILIITTIIVLSILSGVVGGGKL